MAASFVLGSSKSSTYSREYASGFDSPAALLDSHFEHPGRCFPVVLDVWTIEGVACQIDFLQPARSHDR
jgi:hypothetical protein